VTLHVRAIFAVALATGLLSLGSLGVARAGLEIDYIDADNFKGEKNEIVFYADIINDTTGLVVRGQDEKGEGIKILIDGEEIAGEKRVTTFKESGQLMSVAALIAAHYSYADEAIGNEYPKSVLDEVTKGFSEFFSALSDQDRVSAWYYTEATRKPLRVSAWSNSPKSIPGRIESIVQGAKEETTSRPSLYSHISTVLESFGEDTEQPRRKVLIVASDGVDILAGDLNRQDAFQKKMDEIVERATTLGVKIYTVGFSLAKDSDSERLLGGLQTLASRTGGVYRKAERNDTTRINLGVADALKTLADELHNQYVISFKPTEYRGSEKAVDITLNIDGTKDKVSYTRKKEGVKIGERPTDWGAILKIVGIIAGSLLGLFLLVFLFKKIMKARRNRPVATYAEEEFAGPYKGRLMATEGVYAGQEFYIIEDVTTIGSLAGNSIILAEGGVSKRHAGIKVEDMRFELADFGSTNKTHMNGTKITKQFLRDGDEIRLGDNKLRFTLK